MFPRSFDRAVIMMVPQSRPSRTVTQDAGEPGSNPGPALGTAASSGHLINPIDVPAMPMLTFATKKLELLTSTNLNARDKRRILLSLLGCAVLPV